MPFLNVASRSLSQAASGPLPSKIAPKPHANYPPKIPSLKKTCLFPPPMLQYKHSDKV